MKKIFLSTVVMLSFVLHGTAALPWTSISEGNLYWSQMLGVKSYAPKEVNANYVLALKQTHAEPSLRLVNAALKYQISQLPNGDLQRFSDSLSYVLIYLSGASPVVADAHNRAGWWKLSYPVAMRYGLQINENIDERFDFEKSTQAAIRYVRDLQKSFGPNWKQALIESPIAVTRPAFNSSADTLKQSLAALQILIENSAYTKAEEYAVQYFYTNTKYWKTDEAIRADLVIEKTGIPENVFYALNPDVRSKVIPAKTELRLTNLALANLKKYEEDIVLLSMAREEEEQAKLASAQQKIKNNEPSVGSGSRTVYKVKSGDNLGFIAERHGVYVKDLKSWNNLRSDVIYAGQKLVIYNNKNHGPITASLATSTGIDSSPPKAPSFKSGEYVSYKVKDGDTLWSIAQKFPGVSPDNLMAWNGISAQIQVGQQIKVLKSEISNYSAKAYPDLQ